MTLLGHIRGVQTPATYPARELHRVRYGGRYIATQSGSSKRDESSRCALGCFDAPGITSNQDYQIPERTLGGYSRWELALRTVTGQASLLALRVATEPG